MKCQYCGQEMVTNGCPNWQCPSKHTTYPFPEKDTQMWQRCPICNGTGIDHTAYGQSNTSQPVCPTCKGKRIIGVITGKPPIE